MSRVRHVYRVRSYDEDRKVRQSRMYSSYAAAVACAQNQLDWYCEVTLEEAEVGAFGPIDIPRRRRP